MAGSGTLDIERAGENPDPTFGEFLSHLPGIAASYSRRVAGARSRRRGIRHPGAPLHGRVDRASGQPVDVPERRGRHLLHQRARARAPTRSRGSRRPFVESRLRRKPPARGDSLLAAPRRPSGSRDVHVRRARSQAAPRPSLAAFAAALVVPLLFYSFQIYPELPAALLLLFAFRKLVLDPHPSAPGALAAGVALSALPWLHQKYSVVAFVLGLLGLSRFVHRRVGRFALEPRKLVLFSLPLSGLGVLRFSVQPHPHREPFSLRHLRRRVANLVRSRRAGTRSPRSFLRSRERASRLRSVLRSGFRRPSRLLRPPCRSIAKPLVARRRSRISWSSRLFPTGPGR